MMTDQQRRRTLLGALVSLFSVLLLSGPTWLTSRRGGSSAAAAPLPRNPALGAVGTAAATRDPREAKPEAADREIWNRAGIFIAFQGLNPTDLGRTLVVNHFHWAIVPLHDPRNRMDRAWIDQLRAQGIQVGGWAYLSKDPEADAQRYSRMLHEFGLTFFVADAEAEYKTDTGGDYDRSARFVKAFRALEPKLPAALSSYGFLGDWSKMGSVDDRVKMHIFDFAAWRDGGFRWMPQLYWQSYEDYEPVRAVKWALAKGWPKEWIHPTIGLYDPDRGGPRHHTAKEYVAKLEDVKTAGMSVYSANAIHPDDYPVLGEAISRGTIAQP